MSDERPVDVIDWRDKRAKKIVKEFRMLGVGFILVSDKEYALGPYEIIRLVNIFATSNDIRRSLKGFVKLIKRRDRSCELPDWTKPKGGLID